MTKSFSVFLELSRILATLMVFLSHAAWAAGVSTKDYHPGRDGVLIFFLLSGYVISWCADQREPTLNRFIVNRASRIYSVAIPALILGALVSLLRTWVLDAELHYQFNKFYIYAITHLSFTQWHWYFGGATPPANFPYWSLYCEVWYYVIFGLFFYLKGALRWVLPGIAVISLGPTMLLTLFPLWILGSALYFYDRAPAPAESPQQTRWKAAILFTILGYFFSKLLQLDNHLDTFNSLIPFVDEPQLLGDYYLAIFVAIVFFCAKRCEFPTLLRFERPIKIVASYSFTAYLMHIPIYLLLDMFYTIGGVNSAPKGVLWLAYVIPACFAIAVIAPLTEHKKHSYRRFFERLPLLRMQDQTR